jgi:hypothetical protein
MIRLVIPQLPYISEAFLILCQWGMMSSPNDCDISSSKDIDSVLMCLGHSRRFALEVVVKT